MDTLNFRPEPFRGVLVEQETGCGCGCAACQQREWEADTNLLGPPLGELDPQEAGSQVQHDLPTGGIAGTETDDAWKTAAMLRAVEQPLVLSLIAAGQRDPYELTDRMFFLRHKELGSRKIAAGETALQQEWMAILRDVVQPALGSVGLPAPQPAAPATVGGGGAVAEALWIARQPVPKMPGTTIESLVERWRASICPEIPRSILIAFIKYESGGKLTDATHGSQKSGWTSPNFYEIGLFQTPAGLHGRCTSDDRHKCEFDPPGREVPGDPSTWSRLCARIKANPEKWEDPTTQVRVGLLDLELGAQALRNAFPDLFPQPGSDWDLRMAVLYRFARGGGAARSFLQPHRRQLAAMPEDQRWSFLRGKTVTVGRVVRTFEGENVEEKMALAAKLGYAPAGGARAPA